jgi:hypothetical protein
MPGSEDLGAKYLVIYRHPWFLGKDDTASRALLITDPYEIRKVQALMTTIEHLLCMGGAYWSASFWASPFEAVGGFEIKGCTRHDPQLYPYFDQLRTRPTHFIYDLTIPVDIHPEQVIENFEERGLAAFLMYRANPDPAFYRVQLVVDEPDLEVIRQKLARQLPYAIDVTKYDPTTHR